MNCLSSVYPVRQNEHRFWTINQRMLSMPPAGYEALAMSEPVWNTLNQKLVEVGKDLTDKNEFIFSKVRDVFGYRFKLEQLCRSVDAKVAWNSLENIKVNGFDFKGCMTRINNLQQFYRTAATALQAKPIVLVEELPNLSDEAVRASINELKLECDTEPVKFFANTVRHEVMDGTNQLISFSKSVENMFGYKANIESDLKQYSALLDPIKANQTVELGLVHDVIDSVNTRITTVNHLLNAVFVLQTYTKVMDVVFTDAIANLKR